MNAIAASSTASSVNRKLLRLFLIWWLVVAVVLLVVDRRAWGQGAASVAMHAAPPLAPAIMSLSQPGSFNATGWLVTALVAVSWAIAVLQPHESWARFVAQAVLNVYWLMWLGWFLLV